MPQCHLDASQPKSQHHINSLVFSHTLSRVNFIPFSKSPFLFIASKLKYPIIFYSNNLPPHTKK
jgi:hypothetical protein